MVDSREQARRRRNRPISQVEIEEEILRLVELLEHSTEDFAELAQEAAQSESDYKRAWAGQYLSASGAVKEREAWADFRTQEEFQKYKISEALVRSRREMLNATRTSIDALRTLAANVRSMVTGS
jgi:hypothetical protein